VAGAYFQLADYRAIAPDKSDTQFCEWLVKEKGVAAIPLSVFYQTAPVEQRLIRFCFAKNTQTLQLAAERLCKL
jgi:methionine aminotransferase